MRFGYLRESAGEPLIQEATAALETAGCARVIIESMARRSTAPGPALKALVARLQPGDSLVIVALVHIAGDLGQLLEVLADLSRAGVRLEALSGEIDTENPAVVGAIRSLSAFAEHTGKRAQPAKLPTGGAHPRGRPRRLVEVDIERARQLIEGSDRPIREIAQELGVSRATLYRSLRQS